MRFLETLRSAKLRVGRQIAAARRERDEEGVGGATNHFDLIDAAQGLLTDDDWSARDALRSSAAVQLELG